MSQKIKKKPAYSVLADIYDEVMRDVDYETWADYIDEIIMLHNPEASRLLELACGTGTMALSLEELGYYTITATDISAEMIHVANRKGEAAGSDVTFKTMDFLNFDVNSSFDVVFMVFDSLNYLHKEQDIIRLHEQVRTALKPDGVFIYDFTTPKNSRRAIHVLNNNSRRVNPNYRYHRESIYNAKKRIHTNRFHIERKVNSPTGNKEMIEEVHQQRIYSYDEIKSIVNKTDFTILEAYDGFELIPAHENSLRITMVLQ